MHITFVRFYFIGMDAFHNFRRQRTEPRSLHRVDRHQYGYRATRWNLSTRTSEHYLASSHPSSTATRVVTDGSLTAQCEATNPIIRPFHQTVIPSHAFTAI